MACLVVTKGPSEGRHLALQDHELVLIGRDDECTFQVLDDQVSRRHLQIKRESGRGHAAIDFGSANGVLVNGTRIEGPTGLANGDTIDIGNTRIIYSSTDYPDAQTALEAWHKRGEWKNKTIMRKPGG
jgi:pSer/pThr/pTyr-binding forkhead associated (FHA) protein